MNASKILERVADELLDMKNDRLNKQWEDANTMATDLHDALAEATAFQSRFLEDLGMTWEEARSLDQEGRSSLQADYEEWSKLEFAKMQDNFEKELNSF